MFVETRSNPSWCFQVQPPYTGLIMDLLAYGSNETRAEVVVCPSRRV